MRAYVNKTKRKAKPLPPHSRRWFGHEHGQDMTMGKENTQTVISTWPRFGYDYKDTSNMTTNRKPGCLVNIYMRTNSWHTWRLYPAQQGANAVTRYKINSHTIKNHQDTFRTPRQCLNASQPQCRIACSFKKALPQLQEQMSAQQKGSRRSMRGPPWASLKWH